MNRYVPRRLCVYAFCCVGEPLSMGEDAGGGGGACHGAEERLHFGLPECFEVQLVGGSMRYDKATSVRRAYRGVVQSVTGVVDTDPPCNEGFCGGMWDDVGGVRDPLFDFVDEIHGEVVMQREPEGALVRAESELRGLGEHAHSVLSMSAPANAKFHSW